MKRRILISAIAVMTLMTGMVSCEKEEFAEPPQYGKVYCRESNPKVGDTVTLAVQVINPGNRIYHADYTWKCNEVFKQTVKVTAPDGSKTIEAEPTFKWVFKKAGTYDVKMSAEVKISMATRGGQIFLPSISTQGNITIHE